MASLSGVSSSNTVSSLMNSANTITGLASGLDTESMIENLVQSYQTKIESLNKNITKVEWKQEAYRSIISQLVGLSNKYTSYTSSTNLTSPSFFNGAVKVETLGAFADKVSASGKTTSDISLDRVSQLATAAQYRTSSNLKAGDGVSIQAEEGMDLLGKTTLGSLDGSLALTYGSKTVSIQFDKVADVEAMDEIRTQLAEEQGLSDPSRVKDSDVLGRLIENKLASQSVAFTSGGSDTANNCIKVEVKSDGSIQFSDKTTAGNSVYISSASSSVKEAFGLDLSNASTDKITTMTPKSGFGLTTQVDNAEYLSGKTMNLSLDGTTKSIKLPTISKEQDGSYKLLDADGKKLDYTAENYTKVLNDALNTAFKGKVTASNVSGDDSLQLRLEVQEGSDLVMNTDVGATLGIGRAATTYMNTSKTLGELLGKNEDGTLKMDDPEFLKTLTPSMKRDDDGNLVRDASGNFVPLLDEKGNQMFDFEINGTVVGSFSKESKLSEVLDAINNSDDAGVKVSYSQTTKNFLFTSKETGADSEIKIGGGLAEAMFGSTEFDGASGSFAEAYGITWLGDGESEKVTFQFPNANHSLSFNVSADDSIEDVANKLNQSIFNDGYTASYNKYTGKLEVTDKSGAAVDFSMTDSYGDDVKFDTDYAPKISYTPGQDAKFTVTVNGEEFNMTRSSNTVSIDGLTITMKDTFDGYENEDGTPAVDSAGKPKNAVTFKSTTDSDKIVDAIKGMIEEYNAVMSEIKSAYGTLPYQKSDGTFGNYEPLTDDEKVGMSESAIERYEEKAKQGILFGDSELSALYTKLRKVFEPSGSDSSLLRAMGISTTYNISDGSEAIVLDEDKLRSMLESDPDKVADLFTKSDGIMQNMKNVLDTYAKTTGEPKGILVQKAGTPLSSLSLLSNTWQTEIDNYTSQIEKWQDKLEAQVERYTSQFTRLETLINQMNSQSSALAGMLGG